MNDLPPAGDIRPRFQRDRAARAENWSSQPPPGAGSLTGVFDPSGDHPFKIVEVQDGGTMYIKVLPGAVDNIIPTLDGGDTIDTVPPPLAEPPAAPYGGSPKYIYRKDTVDAGTYRVTASNIEFRSTHPTESATTGWVLIASYYTYTDTGVDHIDVPRPQYLLNNQSHVLCGETHLYGPRS